ncbi:MAG: insulinase family protein [Deltaproteobacteria bacterium]|nr:insulinase family protein [Deltaproteobacteria bacterium]
MIPTYKISRIYAFLTAAISFFFMFSFHSFAYDLEKKVQKFTLENGLKVLIVERRLSPTASLYIRYKVGAVDEADGRTGTAHFLEHMLFKGTKTIGTKNYRKERRILEKRDETINALDLEKMKGEQGNQEKIEQLEEKLKIIQNAAKKCVVENEIDRLYTENGGVDLNASTGYDVTTYHVSLPSNKIELWARIEADRMINPVFREFYSERNVVMEERRQTIESNPDRKLMELFLAASFILHPYRRPIIGWSPDMPFLNIDYTKSFFKTYHSPNNTVIAIVGDVSTSQVIDIVRRYFGNIPSQELPVRNVPKEPPQKGERRVHYVADSSPQLYIGYHKPTLPSFDDYAFDIIDTILSRGRTSRLFRSLVSEKGIATKVDTVNGFPGARYSNLFALFATPKNPFTVENLEDAIYEELDRLKNKPVDKREIEKAKNQLKADFLKGLSSNSGLASTLSYYEVIAGDYRYITNHLEYIEKITAQDIMRVANTYLIAGNRTVAELVAKENK